LISSFCAQNRKAPQSHAVSNSDYQQHYP